MLDYSILEKYVVVTVITKNGSALSTQVTSDGVNFITGNLPNDGAIDENAKFTILEAGWSSIFMHVAKKSKNGHNKGYILKSDSDGTDFVLTLPNVNGNKRGFIDFERLQSLGGVLIANTALGGMLGNAVKSQISFNDGGKWGYITPPPVDINGNEFKCKGESLEKCSLNLHGFTERSDYKKSFSSQSAVGILIGIGNVGESLGLIKYARDNSAFMSVDGGLTWKEIRKGIYHWEFGDKGSILVLADSANPTNELVYSSDDGATWDTFTFTDDPVKVLDIATAPSDTELKFVLFADLGRETRIFAIDFSLYYPRQCQLDLKHPTDGDYDFRASEHPDSDEKCLLGRQPKYLRRAKGHTDCFIGSVPLQRASTVIKSCPCNGNDYKCDFNYYRGADGSCQPVPGSSSANHIAQMCSKPDVHEYFKPTGYRRISLTTCVGLTDLDASIVQPCPRREQLQDPEVGLSGGPGTRTFLITFGLAVVLFYVYVKGIRRNGGFLTLSSTKLGEMDLLESKIDFIINWTAQKAMLAFAGGYSFVRPMYRTIVDKLIMTTLSGQRRERAYVSVPAV